ncbi:MAG: sulfatase-like hydrolase/transferase [Prolixibacteraceae bacterium]|nr:sulfatase-like hydrolase/transferase [Prolixibacteraceae bacterium]
MIILKSTFFSILFLFTIAFSVSAKNTLNDAKQSKKPNILFLFTDDERATSVGYLGVENVKTPNIDKIADKGIVFTNTHIMGSFTGAVCMPSRAMLMTGRYLFNLAQGGKNIPVEQKTLPETLKNNGYFTFGTGKWHNGRSSFARSFDFGAKIFFGGMSNHLKVPVYDFDPSGEYPKNKQYIGDKFSSVLFADAAIDFIKNYKNEKPFFAYVAFTSPHDPRMAPDKYVKMYDEDKIVVPPNFKPKHPFDNGELIIRDELLAPFPRTKKIVRQEMLAYYAMISTVDDQIGRILDVLKEKGLDKNTIIVFAGDNGLAVGQHGLLGKQNLYNHSVKVPLIFAGKGIDKTAKNNALCYLSDIFPTLCDLTKTEIPTSVDTKSLMPLIKENSENIQHYSSVYFAYKNFQRGITTQDGWKLITYLVNGKKTFQLFDLNKDPYELNNLWANPAYANRKKELFSLMQNWSNKSGDKVQFNLKDWGVPVVASWVSDRLKKGKPIDGSDMEKIK